MAKTTRGADRQGGHAQRTPSAGAGSGLTGVELALRERVKELRCLYGLAEIIERAEGSLTCILQQTAELLPDSWQYPETTCARVVCDGKSYETAGFAETPHKQAADIVVAGQRVGAVEVYYREAMPSSDEGPFLAEERALINAVAERLARTVEQIRVEAERARAEHDLRERVKELRCLYGFAQLVVECNRNLDRLMQGVTDLLPGSWHYPEITCARVVYRDKDFRTAGFRQTRYRQTAAIVVGGEEVGTVEVCYLQKMPELDEGPFLREERALIDAVAERLAATIERMSAQEDLRKAHAELQVERKALQESNAALRAVLSRIEDEKSSIKQAIVANVEKILMPILHALETELGPGQKGYARLLRHHLEEIASPLADGLSRRALALTPAEIRICSMIKMGLSTKEIANLRRVAAATVSRQRESIRKKLGLAGKGVNLASFLQTFAAGIPRSERPGPAVPAGDAVSGG